MSTRHQAKATLLAPLFIAALLAFTAGSSAQAAEPFRLDRIAIVQFSNDGTGYLQLRNGVLTLDNHIAWRSTQAGALPENLPAAALNRPLVSLQSWQAYRALGAEAVSAFKVLDGAGIFWVGPIGYLAVAPSQDVLPANGLLVNLSTRTQLASGNNAVIAGFVVGERARTVLIRAVGPTLQKFGLGAPVITPSLTLRRDGQIIAQNESWSASPQAAELRRAAARVGAFALDEGSRDAATLVILGPGAYTVQVGSSIPVQSVKDVLVEIYTIPDDFFLDDDLDVN
ncbi:MAG: hypothetical protein Q8N18_14000 [Opitutaceae bacterium]|nr:hypothetical protein [Opitutaceae bacterium]